MGSASPGTDAGHADRGNCVGLDRIDLLPARWCAPSPIPLVAGGARVSEARGACCGHTKIATKQILRMELSPLVAVIGPTGRPW